MNIYLFIIINFSKKGSHKRLKACTKLILRTLNSDYNTVKVATYVYDSIFCTLTKQIVNRCFHNDVTPEIRMMHCRKEEGV